MPTFRKVTVLVSNVRTSDVYLAKSYPDNDFNDDGIRELYKTPVYKVFIKGTDDAGTAVSKEWTALRFMPYWNDPKTPDHHYRFRGWANSGLHSFPSQPAPSYNPDYAVRNSPSAYAGAIQIKGSFLIHAGPATVSVSRWGAAGCIEVIGDFDEFRRQIIALSGSTETDISKGMTALVDAKKLYIQIDLALPPNFKTQLAPDTW